MSFERDFLAMMPETVTYQQFVSLSTDGYGVKTYTTGVGVRARLQPHKTLSKGAVQREVSPAYTVIMAPWSVAGTSDSVRVEVSDRITLPSGFLVAGSSAPPIINAYVTQDDSGLHHNTVLI